MEHPLAHQYGTRCFQPSVHNPSFKPLPVSDPTPSRHVYEVYSPHTPSTLFPSLVIAQLGCTQHRVRFGSDLAALRKDSAHMPRK
ncbi:hypothetical protein BLNAU_10020 [Blattamonas nauphoetae]|uniref:Uncharacterized protein n=1 Tax=Blattamonas nauphoetae TaxID=2049346 RepID=A0ABQ9XUD6_9EUKA|nr:hypothetical protein BLNAU_10020 [Blattamonas nauphoetae]